MPEGFFIWSPIAIGGLSIGKPWTSHSTRSILGEDSLVLFIPL